MRLISFMYVLIYKLLYTSARTGSYVYTESFRWTTDPDEGDTAKLESGYIVATQQQCLSFWYFKTSYIDSLYILQNDNILLQVPENDYDKWNHIQIPLQMTTYKSYKLGFEVKHGSYGSYGTIVIDDILIENQKCNCKYERTGLFETTSLCLLWA